MIIMKEYKCIKKGFTLIEVIVAVAILAIVVTAFLAMFQSGAVEISDAGKKSTSHYNAQAKMESKISDSSIDGTSMITINLNFSGTTYSVEGRKIDIDYVYGKNSKKLTTFNPN